RLCRLSQGAQDRDGLSTADAAKSERPPSPAAFLRRPRPFPLRSRRGRRPAARRRTAAPRGRRRIRTLSPPARGENCLPPQAASWAGDDGRARHLEPEIGSWREVGEERLGQLLLVARSRGAWAWRP